jgi:hemerythrin superfamily protein
MTEAADVIDVLLADHRVIGKLLDELEAAERPEDIRRLYLRIATELAAHEAAEQEVVFPALAVATGSGSGERLGEHEEINDLLAEMQQLGPSSFAFTKRAAALVLDLRAHFECEEEYVFPRLRELFPPERLEELADAVAVVKDAAPAFPPTHAPA